MKSFELTRDVYTEDAIDGGIAAFAAVCAATAIHETGFSFLTILTADSYIASELLNYILAASAQELLS